MTILLSLSLPRLFSGGPDSGNVKDFFPYGEQRKDFHNFLANGEDGKPQFLVYMVDVRGTLGRGDDFR